MHMLYNSENFAVVRFDVPAEASQSDSAAAPSGGGSAEAMLTTPMRGGYEIVDKSARKEIFIQGVLAESFQTEVQALIDGSPTEEAFDDFLGRYTSLMQQTLVLH
jgi:hypothetical protein